MGNKNKWALYRMLTPELTCLQQANLKPFFHISQPNRKNRIGTMSPIANPPKLYKFSYQSLISKKINKKFI
jgi:hypothetical protein